MRRSLCTLRALAFAAIAVAGLLGSPSPALADGDPRIPTNLRVIGGESSWHPDPYFQLTWDPPATASGVSPDVRYLIRDASGNVVVPPAAIPWSADHSGYVSVPHTAGRYTAEVWLEDGTGPGSHADAALLFDDARPPMAKPLAPSGWIAGGVPVTLHVAGPATPSPLSGIRGFAVSVDRDPAGSPCAGPDRCTEAEIDLAAGSDGGDFPVGALPEGTSLAHLLTVSGSGMRSPEVSTVEIRVDATSPDVTLTGVPVGWADGPVRVVATATDALSGMAAAGPGGPFTAVAIDGAAPTVSPGPAAAATVFGDGVHEVVFYGRDAAGNTGDGRRGSPPPASALLRIDSSPPRVAFLAARDPAEPERLEAVVSDPLSGPSAARGVISVRAAGSGRQFAPLPTAVSGDRLVARWNSDAYADGTYEFSATGFDAAGNSAASDRRLDGARMVLANPLKTPTEIRAGLPGRQGAGERYGARIPIAGRLTSTVGSPLPGRRVEIVENFAAGAAASERTTTVLTAPDGTFQVPLAPGPSRTVEARFAGDRLLTRTGSEPLRLPVASGLRFRSSRSTAAVGGAPVRFSGRVGSAGSKIPRSGLAVELQFRIAGSPWSEFRTTQTDRRGRFAYPYAFSDDDSRGVRFQFRAYLPRQGDWPYEPGTSKPVAVTGR
jgi:hypothetical protein